MEADPEDGKEGIDKQVLYDEDGQLCVRKGGQAKIHKKFMSFYINKQQAPDYSKARAKRARPETAQPSSNTPQISEKSKKLAEQQRSKYGGQPGGTGKRSSAAVVEHLLAKERVRAEEFKQREQDIRQRKEQDPDATFRPVTNHYPLAARETSGSKCLDLYSRSKPGAMKANNGRSKIDAEFEKEQKECSFKPQINKPGAHLKGAQKRVDVLGLDEQKARLEKGREKEQIRKDVASRNPTNPAFGSRKTSMASNLPEAATPSMGYSKQTSKFKSAFGEAPKVPKSKKVGPGNSRKPVSFFDSQKVEGYTVPNQ